MTDDVPGPQPFRNKALAHAYLNATARIYGAAGVCALFVERLRASNDALDQALADLIDPHTPTDIRIAFTLGWKDHANPARDIEIAGVVEAVINDGTKTKIAIGMVADRYGLSAVQVKRQWLKCREKIRNDLLFAKDNGFAD